MTTRIIIDTDPGQDDALAILLALASPELDVLALTTVAGNVWLPLTTANALRILELAGRPDVPVYAGAQGPLRRAPVTAEEVHGSTGLDGPDLPEPRLRARETHAVDFLVETLRREPEGSITLATLGPLTNIALAFGKAPDIAARVARIVAMGGGRREGGNITPVAEFNIFADPHAAEVVFAAGVPLVLHPLDVTHQCLTTPARIAAFRQLGTPVGTAVAAMLDFARRYDEARYGTDGGPLHDPNVIAWLLAPGLYQGRDVNVEIETGSDLTMGQTVIDWWGATGRRKNAHVVHGVDADAFFALLTSRLARLPAVGRQTA